MLERVPFHIIRNAGLVIILLILGAVSLVGLGMGRHSEKYVSSIIEHNESHIRLFNIKSYLSEAYFRYSLAIQATPKQGEDPAPLFMANQLIAATIAQEARSPQLRELAQQLETMLNRLENRLDTEQPPRNRELPAWAEKSLEEITVLVNGSRFVHLLAEEPTMLTFAPALISQTERLTHNLREMVKGEPVSPESIERLLIKLQEELSLISSTSAKEGIETVLQEEMMRIVLYLKKNAIRIAKYQELDISMTFVNEELQEIDTYWKELDKSIDILLQEDQQNVQTKQHAILTAMDYQIRYSIALFSLAGIFAVLLSYVIHKTVNARVEFLVDNINEYAKGRYQHRIDITAHDQLSKIGVAFNKMAKQLSRKEASLQAALDQVEKAKDRLEERVAQRTAELEQANRRLVMMGEVFEHSREGILVADTDTTIIDVNPACTDILGYSRQEIIGQKPTLFKSGRHDSSFYDQLWHSLNTYGFWNGEIWNRRKNGNIFPQMTSISNLKNDVGELIGYVSVLSDYSDKKRKEELIRHQATHDHLTGLPNRAFFMEQIDKAIDQAQEAEESLALLFIDLDDFKQVNDTLGHKAGDEVLKETATRLKRIFRSSDIICRLGGDEFVVLMSRFKDKDTVQTVATRSVDTLCSEIQYNGEACRVGVSIGIALFPDDTDTADSLLKKADAAMYAAKQNGKNQIMFCEWNCLDDDDRQQ